MTFSKPIRTTASVVVFIAVIALGITAGAMVSKNANAAGNPAPKCPAPYVFKGTTGKCALCPQGSQYDNTCKAVPVTAQPCTTTTNANGTTTTICPTGVQASASDIDTGRITILGYIQANGLAKALVTKLTAQGKCRWVGQGTDVPVFTNSGARSGYGPYGKFKDTRRTFACNTGKGPSGWQKAFDISPLTHQKEHACANYLWLGISQPLITGQVIVVRNLASVHMHLHAEAHVTASSSNCPGTVAEGSGQADITITLSEYMRSHGDVISQLSASAYGKATAEAHASVTCGPTVTTVVTTTTQAPPPPTQTVTQTVTTQTTTTQTTTTTQPKSNIDLCINIDGEQTAVPAGYRKDPPDAGVPGNCYYVGP